MLYIKIFSATLFTILIGFSGMLYGYKLGLSDMNLLVDTNNGQSNLTHILYLKKQGAQQTIKLIEESIDDVIPSIANSDSSQSILSRYLGPASDKEEYADRLKLYKYLIDYRKENPSTKALEWDINYLKDRITESVKSVNSRNSTGRTKLTN